MQLLKCDKLLKHNDNYRFISVDIWLGKEPDVHNLYATY